MTSSHLYTVRAHLGLLDLCFWFWALEYVFLLLISVVLSYIVSGAAETLKLK